MNFITDIGNIKKQSNEDSIIENSNSLPKLKLVIPIKSC